MILNDHSYFAAHLTHNSLESKILKRDLLFSAFGNKKVYPFKILDSISSKITETFKSV